MAVRGESGYIRDGRETVRTSVRVMKERKTSKAFLLLAVSACILVIRTMVQKSFTAHLQSAGPNLKITRLMAIDVCILQSYPLRSCSRNVGRAKEELQVPDVDTEPRGA